MGWENASYHFFTSRLMSTEKGVLRPQKEMRSIRWTVNFVSWHVMVSFQVMSPQPGLRRTFEFHLKCRWMKKTAAFEIIADPPGKAWLGVNNINVKRVNPRREEVHIKRHIRHENTYRWITYFAFSFCLRGGGTYGHFGGHDITLLELERPIFGFRTACLPR